MSARLSIPRRMAVTLMEHAAHMLPAARSPWAEAMQHELHHIEGDLEALMWAVGCVFASYVERSKVMDVIYRWYARALLAVLIGSQVLSMLFATVLTAAYRLHYLGVAAFLGGFTRDYLIPAVTALVPVSIAAALWAHGRCSLANNAGPPA